MSLADDLLAQARHLANMDKKRPRQANLRRAISAAYYALFHLLVAEASNRFTPGSPANLASRVGRSLQHSEMKQTCRAISESHSSKVFEALLPHGFGEEIHTVANGFVRMQARRHEADYDLTMTYSRTETLNFLSFTEDVFAAWSLVRNTDEANVFLAALLFGNRWAK